MMYVREIIHNPFMTVQHHSTSSKIPGGVKACWLLTFISLFGCHTPKQNVSSWKNIPQNIPGKVQCELYDTGGEGISYHDSDSINNGSGKLNPANGTILNEFRMREGVDISYTKAKNIDNHPFNFTNPQLEQLYVGWTVPGEWFKCKVKIAQAGKYRIGIMYTANRDASISLQFTGANDAVPIAIPSTYNAQDTIPWRQWHHWRKLEKAGEIELQKGINILKVQIVDNGNINLDYIEFIRKDE
ncbi:MAG: carbohydrate-binding domain-containing protein [Chryseolinea sp.]